MATDRCVTATLADDGKCLSALDVSSEASEREESGERGSHRAESWSRGLRITGSAGGFI